MPQNERSSEVDHHHPGIAVELTTRAGKHIFTARDRLWVRNGTEPPQSRAATEVCAGDLVAFLGRVLSVRTAQEVSQQRSPTRSIAA